jgi:hypothetical protein
MSTAHVSDLVVEAWEQLTKPRPRCLRPKDCAKAVGNFSRLKRE